MHGSAVWAGLSECGLKWESGIFSQGSSHSSYVRAECQGPKVKGIKMNKPKIGIRVPGYGKS